jgi:hypothetical protein
MGVNCNKKNYKNGWGVSYSSNEDEREKKQQAYIAQHHPE